MPINDNNARLCGIGTLLLTISSAYSFFTLFVMLFAPAAFIVLPFSFIFSALSLAGFILYMVGVKGLSVRYQTPAIFNNALYALLTVIVGVAVIFGVTMIVSIISISSLIDTLVPFGTTTNVLNSPAIIATILLAATIAASVVGLIATRFFYLSYKLLSEKSGIKRFRTAGLLFPISVILAVSLMLLGVASAALGTIPLNAISVAISVLTTPINAITCAAWILATLAFFSVKAAPIQAPTYPPSYQYTTPQVKYCTYCGSQNRIDAKYCANCGKPM